MEGGRKSWKLRRSYLSFLKKYGKPLIARTIEQIATTRLFSHVLVTTDAPEIAEIARSAGAWVPFLRPPELSGDEASSLDALFHAVAQAATLEPEWRPPFIALFQPTSPFLTAAHIKAAVELYQTEGFTSLSSMCAVSEHPAWMFRVQNPHRAQPLHPEDFFTPTADLPGLYRENGALYFVKTEFLQENRLLYHFSSHGMFLMSKEDSVDIDTQTDWDYAEFLLRHNPL